MGLEKVMREIERSQLRRVKHMEVKHDLLQVITKHRLERWGRQVYMEAPFEKANGHLGGVMDLLNMDPDILHPRIYEIKSSGHHHAKAESQLRRAYDWMNANYGLKPRLVEVWADKGTIRARRVHYGAH